jgi:hypothetical protein
MKKLIFFSFLGASVSLQSQLLELDFSSPVQRESFIKVKLFKQFMGGVTTLGHLDISTEAININYSSSSGFVSGLSVVGTNSLFSGNKSDERNNLSHILNPHGGAINGSLCFQIPLQEKEKSKLRIYSRFGAKFVQGSPLRGFESSYISRYGMLGGVYQRLLFEDAPENQRIDFWIYPHLMLNQMGEGDVEIFFNDELKPLSYGYGLQTGIEFNQKLRLIFLLNQFVNVVIPESLGTPVLRFTPSYRFKT